MPRITLLLFVAVGLTLPGSSAWAGSRGKKKPPPPLAKLVKGQIVLAKRIEFASWRVRKSSYPVLKAVARIMRKHRKLKVRIEAHSDSLGSARWNRKHTQKKAEDLKKILVKMGIKAHRLQAVGRGEVYPIASNRTAAGRDKNRRIELRVIPRKNRKRQP